ncbi:MAG: hypothetical protein KAR39_04395 [Thermoplasmata archaeon]|nr:hypothetical protein [Thermoplasmata archaeon]
MPYTLVKGEFHLYYKISRHVGSRPDGDSLWFKPNDPAKLSNIAGRGVSFNNGGCAQLRFETIDALELHYKGTEQNHDLAVAARDCTTEEAGFTGIEYAPELYTSVRTATPHPTKGYILTRNVDPYGRPVSFVFAGTTNQPEDDKRWLDTKWLDESFNAALARSGNAYPAFYTGLPTDLRNRILELVAQARKTREEVWKKDSSTKGFRLSTLKKLEDLTIWPKLFRRLVTYFKDDEFAGIAGFDAWLRASSTRDDKVWIISKGELGNMHDVIEVQQNKMLMIHRPGDLIIVPR